MQESPTSAAKTTIMVVDDHPIVRRGLAQLINQQGDLTVCCEAEDAQQALDLVGTCRPDSAIVDLSLRSSSGLDLVKSLHKQHPELPVLVVSMHEEELYAERALRAGARGYVMKREVDETVIKAIRRVLAGGIYASEKVAARILSSFATSQGQRAPLSVEGLSDRELAVFRLIGRGVKTGEIAEELRISVKTVETYRARIKSKLSLSSSSELTRFAVEWSLSEGTR